MDTKTLLKLIGGQAAIAQECEISESAVSQWVDGDWIPNARRKYLQLAHPGVHWIEYGKYLDEKRDKAPVSKAQEASETATKEPNHAS